MFITVESDLMTAQPGVTRAINHKANVRQNKSSTTVDIDAIVETYI